MPGLRGVDDTALQRQELRLGDVHEQRVPGDEEPERESGEALMAGQNRAAVEAGVERSRRKAQRKAEITKRAIELRRLDHSYREIAEMITAEGTSVSEPTVRRYIFNSLKPEAQDPKSVARLREQEIDKVESAARKVRMQIDRMEEGPEHLFDAELFAKLSETYLKYRDRVARLRGYDQGGNMGSQKGMKEVADALPAEQHLHVHMPGSVQAFAEWQDLTEQGLTKLAEEVLELEAGPDETVTGTLDDPAGTTLAPNAIDELLPTRE